MGYFSNGSEGESWEARWCARCVHSVGHDPVWSPNGCPVLELQYLWNREQTPAANDLHNHREPKDPASHAKLIALETLISSGESGLENHCRMFHERQPEPTRQQLVMAEIRDAALAPVAGAERGGGR